MCSWTRTDSNNLSKEPGYEDPALKVRLSVRSKETYGHVDKCSHSRLHAFHPVTSLLQCYHSLLLQVMVWVVRAWSVLSRVH